jgi:hypothetical protein
MPSDDFTRREVIGRLIKTTLFTVAIPHILLVQTTRADTPGTRNSATVPVQQIDPKELLKPVDGEKVVIIGKGTGIVFTIMGAPGRYCRLVYAREGSSTYFTPRGGSGVIGNDGRLTLSLDVRQFGSQRLLFRVGTSSSRLFDRDDLRGTEPFEVSIQNGAVATLSGIRERQTIGKNATAASFAAACAVR